MQRTQHSRLWRSACVATAVIPLSCGGQTVDWRYSIGLHDMAVPDVSSDTFGVSGGAAVDKHTASGRHYLGSFDLFVDHDTDHLDPDHIPIWWMLHLASDGKWQQVGDASYLGWTADFNTRMNTVSSIERQIKAFPAVVVGHDGAAVNAALEAGIGYFFQEIDDDAPKSRGFDRSGLRQTTAAESIVARANVRLATSWHLAGRAQQWWDGSEWLESQYNADVRFDVSRWIQRKGSELVLSAELYEYNLDRYPHSDAGLPILDWNNDILIKLSYSAALNR